MSPTPDPLAAVARLPEVFEAVEAARGSVDALLRDLRALRCGRRVTEVTAEAVRLGGLGLGRLEGRDGGAEDVRRSGRDVLGANALRLHVELASLAETWDGAPLQALARMHVLAAAGLVA